MIANPENPTFVGEPRIYACNWFWCPEVFRDGSDLARHLKEAHFNNIAAVNLASWDDYLRYANGMSGATGEQQLRIEGMAFSRCSRVGPRARSPPKNSWMAAIPSQSTLGTTHSGTPTTSQALPSNPSGIASQPGSAERSPPPSTPAKLQIPRNLSRARPGPDQTPPASQAGLNASPVRAFAVPETANPRTHPSPVDASPASTSISSSSSSADERHPKRRRTSFASYAAQSSPMSTPSVSSMPPSPPLTNMITDALNAAARLNANTPGMRLGSQPGSRGSQASQSPLSGGARQAAPIPRRTNMGASPSPAGSGPRFVSQAQVSPSSRMGLVPLTSRSSLAASVASAQAVEDALTQSAETSTTTSPVQSQSHSQSSSDARSLHPKTGEAGDESAAGSRRSYPPPHNGPLYLIPDELTVSSPSRAGPTARHSHSPSASASQTRSATQPTSNGSPGGAYTQHESRATRVFPASQPSPSTNMRSQASPKSPVPVAPIPRTRRTVHSDARHLHPPVQAQSQAQANAPAPVPVPIPRNLRTRSKTPAPAASSSQGRIVPPIPRRTARSRASSTTASADASVGMGMGQTVETKPVAGVKRSRSRSVSKPPSSVSDGREAPVPRRSSRVRSRSVSKPPPSIAGAGVGQGARGGLEVVQEQPDDSDNGSSQPQPRAQAQSPTQSQPQTGFRSGTLSYVVPIPRRTRARSQQPQSQSQSQCESQPSDVPMKSEPVTELVLPVEMDAEPLPSQRGRSTRTHTSSSSSRSPVNALQQSQSQQGGYVEGYGFDMGSVVLQTQAPFKWGDSPSP
ncbi:hypothetical protein C8Q77DRAFT_299603 [Trametes polyzona]|nr:hypothetical protein C8Q77DRAFT_299603 [Trametes polyzona]